MKAFLFSDNSFLKDLGLLVMRVGLGIIFVKHGYGKITGGTEKFLWLGRQMGNLGIHYWPLFWGVCAAISEFFGGAFLMAGLLVRPTSFFLACVMFVAAVYHASKGDPYTTLSHPLSLFIIFIGFMLTGGGKFSFDSLILKK